MPHLRAAGTVAALVFLVSCRSTGPPPTAGPVAPGHSAGEAVIEHVVDGDTVDVDLDGRDERVRLIGIDTPETKDQDSPVECYGPEATALTELLVPPGTAVRLERDVEARDDYGRLLAYVYLTDAGGRATTQVNMEIVEQGFARPLTIEPNSIHAREFSAAASRAERSGLGLWAACSS
jgi:micrococcal nuclease